MNVSESLKGIIDRGRQGDNVGLSTGFKKLDRFADGIQRESITTILAGSGAGKTSCALYILYNALMYSDKTHLFYFSLEMSAEVLYAKLISLYLWDVHSKIIRYKDIMSRQEPMKDSDYQYVLKGLEWIGSIEDRIVIHDKLLTCGEFTRAMKAYSDNFGVWSRTDFGDKFEPNDPSIYNIVILDHVSLMTPSTGKTLKGEIDEMVKWMIYFRTKMRLTAYFVQQLNRNASSTDRRKAGHSAIELQDAQDTSATIQASDYVLGLYYPHREQQSTYGKPPHQYAIQPVHSRFRVLQLLKNRFGESDKAIPVCLYGEVNTFIELPKASEIVDISEYNLLKKKYG